MIKIPPTPIPVKKETHQSTCWSCGASSETPDRDRQIEILRDIQRARTPIFHWSELQLQLVRDRLEEGGVIVFGAIYYGSVKVRRGDGSVIEISEPLRERKGCVISRVFVASVLVRRIDGVEFEVTREDDYAARF